MPRTTYAVVAAIALATAGCGGSDSGDAAVAHVGGTAITRAQLDQTIHHFEDEASAEGRPFPEAGTAQYRTAERQLVALLVYRAELVQSAARLRVPVTEHQVTQRLRASSNEEGEQPGAFARGTVRAQIAYEHIYRKVAAGVPAARREQVVGAWVDKMKRDYSTKVSYEPGFGPGS